MSAGGTPNRNGVEVDFLKVLEAEKAKALRHFEELRSGILLAQPAVYFLWERVGYLSRFFDVGNLNLRYVSGGMSAVNLRISEKARWMPHPGFKASIIGCVRGWR